MQVQLAGSGTIGNGQIAAAHQNHRSAVDEQLTDQGSAGNGHRAGGGGTVGDLETSIVSRSATLRVDAGSRLLVAVVQVAIWIAKDAPGDRDQAGAAASA